jgi:hypothetical protein
MKRRKNKKYTISADIFVEAIIFSALENAQPKFPRYFVEAIIFSVLDNVQPKFPRYFQAIFKKNDIFPKPPPPPPPPWLWNV